MAPESERRKAFEDLFRTHYGEVRAYLLRRGATAVEDALGETFLVAWRRFEAIPNDSLPWLYGVARRVLANQRRSERRQGALSRRLRSTAGAAGEERERLEGMSDEWREALHSLPQHELEALLLVAWEGLAPGRAARAAGCTPAAFRVRLYRARRRLTAVLTDPGLNQPDPEVTKELL